MHIAELEAAIAELLKDDADGQRLQAIPGIGPLTAATIRAELGDVTRFQRVDEVVAYAGLDPRTRQSGAFVGQKHLSKRGPGALRHALYLAAFVAARCVPEWRSATNASSLGAMPRRRPLPSWPARFCASSTTCSVPARPTIPPCSTSRRRRRLVDNPI